MEGSVPPRAILPRSRLGPEFNVTVPVPVPTPHARRFPQEHVRKTHGKHEGSSRGAC